MYYSILLPSQPYYYLPRPNGDSSNDLRNLMRNLAALTEQEQCIAALLTLTEEQDDEGLIALRAIFDQLVANACKLVSFHNCALVKRTI